MANHYPAYVAAGAFCLLSILESHTQFTIEPQSPNLACLMYERGII